MDFYPVLNRELNIDEEIVRVFGNDSNMRTANSSTMSDSMESTRPLVSSEEVRVFGNDSNMRTANSSTMSDSMESTRPLVSSEEIGTLRTLEMESPSRSGMEVDSAMIITERERERSRIQRLRERQRNERVVQGPQYNNMMMNLSGEHYLGRMRANKCQNCGANLFEDEIPNEGLGKVTVCCQKGKVKFDLFDDYPEQVKVFLNGVHQKSNEFFNRIRVFNNALAMASVSANMPVLGGGPPVLAVHGQMYRQVGVLAEAEDVCATFAQLYVMDPDEAAEKRLANHICDPEVMHYLSSVFLRKNVLAQSYRMMGDVMRDEKERAVSEGKNVPEIRMSFVTSRDLDLRRYNEPIVNEVAIVYVVNDEVETPPPRFLTVYDKGRGLRSISEINALCDPLTYPLLYPTGRKGWEPEMIANPFKNSSIRLSQREFYAFLLFTRASFNPLHLCRRLFQQYVIDAYLKIESSRIRFFRANQDKFRLETIAGLTEFIETENSKDDVGQRIILPNSFVGSPRAMKKSYQDAMAIVGKFGKPDLFITVTANPHWKEIQENLEPGQIAAERPDVVARVFQYKLKSLINDIKNNNLFGSVAAYVAVVEWQKRGLPHCHILISLHQQHKIRTAFQTDNFIKAEIPDPEVDMDLYTKVTKHMMHRVCFSLFGESAQCYESVNGVKKCNKAFPKAFSENTLLNEDSYAVYKRRNNGKFIVHNNVKLDNSYVVPYSPFLLKKYNCHINVEVCGMIKAVKYLFKYVYKGHDRARLRLENRQDEISSYVDGRYICAPEAIHRILGYNIENRSHSVFSLHVHELHNRYIRFQLGKEQEALNRVDEGRSTLEAWFELNKNESNSRYDIDLSTLLYADTPKYFIFESGKWRPRKKICKPVIGRIQFVSPQQKERFALRILLLNRTNMKSFTDMRTVNGQEFSSFTEAATALGLMQDDRGFHDTLKEAAAYHMPYELRKLFAMLIGYNERTDVKHLWDAFKMDLTEDFVHNGFSVELAEAKVYYEIETTLLSYGKDLGIFLEKPTITRDDVVDVGHNLPYMNEGERLMRTLNSQQKQVFDTIIKEGSTDKLFFVDGPGGSGKTYLYKTLFNYLMGMKKKVVCIAWTGIAALLLPDGRTCHSTFKLPLDFGSPFLGMNRNTKEGRRLKEIDVIIWDEFSMVPGKALYYVNDLLKYVMESTELFGGKIMICGGDFRQVLPVEEPGLSLIASTVKGLQLWKSFKKLSLSENMRVTNNNDWISFLLDVGVGRNMTSSLGKVSLPSTMFTNNIIKSVFGDRIKVTEIDDISSRVILAPKNVSVNHLNEEILDKLDGEERIYTSIDQIIDTNNFTEQISVEFLQSLSPTGFPPAKLRLKVGAIVILLRNLDITNGLANGTRLVILKMDQRVLMAKILTGSRVGNHVLIPKISLICDRSFSIKFKRYQFPVKLSFAMSIHKSQGQTFTCVGIYLLDPVFAHGQLYVALSRCSNPHNIHIYSHDPQLVNIVEKGIFQ